MKLFGKSIGESDGIGVKILVIGITVATGVWVAAHMDSGITASSGRVEAIVLEAQTKVDKPMWDPRDPKTAQALSDPGRVRQIENAASANQK